MYYAPMHRKSASYFYPEEVKNEMQQERFKKQGLLTNSFESCMELCSELNKNN